ncbi:MAG TPA: transposase [Vicinamibacterales bacterium]|nr:transposase [Vicinamibacterales bacterium]
MILTYRYRIKDATHRSELQRQARVVNFVWNFCAETHRTARRSLRRPPSAYDLHKLTAGTSRELGVLSNTIQAVCQQFVRSACQHKRRPRWRGKKSLGWIPFKSPEDIRLMGDTVTLLGRCYRLWLSRPMEGRIKAGNFSADARERWYLNLSVEIDEAPIRNHGPEIGVDLGLATLATYSTGERIENPRYARCHSERLVIAQRAGRKARARAIHARIANGRRHYLHLVSTRLVREYRLIVVGNINMTSLVRTSMAKSMYDTGWSLLRGMLRYKSHQARRNLRGSRRTWFDPGLFCVRGTQRSERAGRPRSKNVDLWCVRRRA